MQWDLTVLYPDFGEGYQKDYEALSKALKTHLSEIKEIFSRPLSGSAVWTYLQKQNALLAKWLRLYHYPELLLAANSGDENALAAVEQAEKLLPDLSEAEVLFTRWLREAEGVEKLIEEAPALLPYRFYLEDCLQKSCHMLSAAEERILSEMKNTGSKAWGKLFDRQTSELLVEINGERIPLSEARAKAYDPEEEVRKASYFGELSALQTISSAAASALNAIKGEAIYESKLRGYESVLAETLMDSRMSQKALDALWQAVREALPKFREYFKEKAKVLGKEKPAFYDLFAPIGESHKSYSYEEAQEVILEAFGAFSQKLRAFAEKAFREHWIDVLPREGKVGGAFCANLHEVGESRILTNFTGSFSDVVTLAHELGHAYHGEVLCAQPTLLSDYPMPIAETASTFCETLVKAYLIARSEGEERRFMLENDLQDASQVVVDIYSRFLFESRMIEERKKGSLSANRLSALMAEAQKEAYGEGLNEAFLHPLMWAVKSHYYDADCNFYNFPYAFGLLFAKGLYAKAQEEGEGFLAQYDALLFATGNHSLKSVGKMAGIDIESYDFWWGALKQIEGEIERFIDRG